MSQSDGKPSLSTDVMASTVDSSSILLQALVILLFKHLLIQRDSHCTSCHCTWPVTFPATCQRSLTEARNWVLSEDVFAFHGSPLWKVAPWVSHCNKGQRAGPSGKDTSLYALKKAHIMHSNVL